MREWAVLSGGEEAGAGENSFFPEKFNELSLIALQLFVRTCFVSPVAKAKTADPLTSGDFGGARAAAQPFPFVLRYGPSIAFLICMSPSDAPASSALKPSRYGALVSVLALGLLAAGAVYWNAQRSGPEGTSDRGSSLKGTLHLETFVLNLADPQQRSYLRVGIDLGLSHEIAGGENAPVAEVRDTILGVLAQCRVDDLLTAAGKTQLKEDLLRALQARVPSLGIEEIYFTEFLIQR